MPDPSREEIIAAIERQYDGGEPDPALEAIRRACGEADEETTERDNLIAGINKAFNYDPDTEGMDADEAERFRAFKSSIDRTFPKREG